MMYLWLLITALVVALVFMLLFFYILKKANELTKHNCNNCGFYDRILNTCWAKMETRYPDDRACDLSRPRLDKDEFEPRT